MIDTVTKGLEDVKKKAEKSLIHFFTASHSKATSETQKQVVKEMEKEAVQKVHSSSEKYLDSFSSSVQGKWSKAANGTFKNTNNVLRDL
ncbi:hypothetical protein ACRW9N_02060 [Listeria aquatica]|uniref:Uncharacterized protein n=1 Tax=Listeria aquatica FSL S10-1188 TaxID=1265818 RepID=W7AYD6_9LIST|nr:hypothetical protein [Listeria aquatica]EUJ18632.1 hypothetical protein MAQA_08607 [Listeria aquatica FSL S10-1188]